MKNWCWGLSRACSLYPDQKGKGVCGTSWEQKQSIIVPDVTAFPGHIACSSRSISEIVVPLISNNQVKGVLDADSEYPAAFDGMDRRFLEEIAGWIYFNNK